MPETPIVLAADRTPSLRDVLRVAGGTLVDLDPATKSMLDERREQVLAFVNRPGATPAYGFNRGFGHNVRLAVNPQRCDELQVNLLRSHSCGVGEAAPREVVRATMFLRAVSLVRGHSGVRAEVIEKIVALLNTDIVPVVPRLGSVSASGDLAPLSHMALALLGEGEDNVICRGKTKDAAKALEENRISPLRLEMKEGLALNNGVQFSTAYGIWCLERLEDLLKTAVIGTALSAQVMLGADTPFRSDLNALRRHRGSLRVARWLLDLMKDSPLRKAHQDFDVDGEIQDPYNLRCAPQILGACAELLERARKTFDIEVGSVTDNPLILAAKEEFSKAHNGTFLGEYVDIVSGGHFHGMPIAVDLYGLLQVCAITARLSNMRAARYVDEQKNKGLGSDLKWPGNLAFLETFLKMSSENQREFEQLPEHFREIISELSVHKKDFEENQALSSAFMMPEYVSAGLTNWIWGSCMPVHLFSLSTDAGQEDHVSMATNVAVRLYDCLPRVAEILAIELAFAAQAAALRKKMGCIPSLTKGWHPLKEKNEACLNVVGEAVLETIESSFEIVQYDRPLSKDIGCLGNAVLNGEIVRAAEASGFVFAECVEG